MYRFHKSSIAALLTTLCALGAAQAQTAAADPQQGVLWQVGVDVAMSEPMPMTMPTYSSKVCGSANPQAEAPPLKNGQCRVEDMHQGDTRVNYTVVCDMRHGTMRGKGWAERTDADHYRGHLDIAGETYGKAMAIGIDYHGTRVGPCQRDDSSG